MEKVSSFCCESILLTTTKYKFQKSLKEQKKTLQEEEDKPFRPPDFEQDKHQDITGFIVSKEAPLDPAYKTKPSKNRFGIRFTL
ncbi:hypothetical protein YC2023_098896 [Brassica napus]